MLADQAGGLPRCFELLSSNVVQVSVEAALKIVYQPQAVFRVRPLTRCTGSLPGELASAHDCRCNAVQWTF